MEAVEIKKLSDKELNEKVGNEKQMLVKLNLQHAVSPIENPMRVRAQRKLVARLLTEVSARKKGVATPAAKVEAPKAEVKKEKVVKAKAAYTKAKTTKPKAAAKTK
jgi:large subunit ribosomal protein L29